MDITVYLDKRPVVACFVGFYQQCIVYSLGVFTHIRHFYYGCLNLNDAVNKSTATIPQEDTSKREPCEYFYIFTPSEFTLL